MRGAIHGPGGVRVDEREAPQIVEPTDASRAMDERDAVEVLPRP